MNADTIIKTVDKNRHNNG